MTIVLIQIFSHIEKRVEHSTRILFHCLLIHKRCRWTSTWIQFFLRNSLVSHPISTVNFWLFDWAATYWNMGKYSTRTPLAHRQFCQSFCIPEIFRIRDGMTNVQVILSHEYCWFQCYRHEHSSYHRMFFVIFCNIHRRWFLSFPHLVNHPLQEWSGSQWQFWSC